LPVSRLDPPGVSHAVFSFPSADELFRSAAVETVEALRTPGQPTWADLRMRFPAAELHRQRAVIVDGKAVDTWFAFRDGRDQPSCPTDEWWTSGGVARATLGSTGRVTNRSANFQQLFGVRVGTTSHAAAELLTPSLVETLTGPHRTLWPLSVASTAMLPTRTGETNMEFRIGWDADGGDRHQFAARTFEERTAAHHELALLGSSLRVLTPARRGEAMRGSRVRKLRAGERLQESLAGASWAALVVCGVARLYVARDNVEPTLKHAAAGTLLGSHIGPGRSSLAIGLQAVTPCRVVLLDPGRVSRMATVDGGFATAISDDGLDTLAALIDTYAVRSAAGLGRRLAHDVIAIGGLHGEGGFVPVTEQQLADGLGSIRESVARTIGEFRRRGWIATTRYGLAIRDGDALAAHAAVD
jgi:CRP-like cAMP-binding protein